MFGIVKSIRDLKLTNLSFSAFGSYHSTLIVQRGFPLDFEFPAVMFDGMSLLKGKLSLNHDACHWHIRTYLIGGYTVICADETTIPRALPPPQWLYYMAMIIQHYISILNCKCIFIHFVYYYVCFS